MMGTAVTPEDFENIHRERDAQKRTFQCFLYDARKERLYVTVPVPPHEMMHTLLYHKVKSLFTPVEASKDWEGVGSTLYSGTAGTRAVIGAGEGSAGGKPCNLRCLVNDWPTLMIEVGYSASVVDLRQKMEWWFEASHFQVKVVLLVCFDTSPMKGKEFSFISIEQWVRTPLKKGLYGNESKLRPPMLQSHNQITYTGPPITAANQRSILPSMFNVSGTDIILKFKLLMLRERPAAHGEEDLVISKEWLQIYGMKIWKSVASYRSGAPPW